jgi:sucrose-6-phosphate hydrolase SacC (GH32 family)
LFQFSLNIANKGGLNDIHFMSLQLQSWKWLTICPVLCPRLDFKTKQCFAGKMFV